MGEMCVVFCVCDGGYRPYRGTGAGRVVGWRVVLTTTHQPVLYYYYTTIVQGRPGVGYSTARTATALTGRRNFVYYTIYN